MGAPDSMLQVTPGNDPATAGYQLRSAREHLNLSLRDVASALNLMVSHVRSMEMNRCAHLTNDKHYLLHIRSYAELVNLDADELVALYRAQSATAEATISAQPVKGFRRLQHCNKTWYGVGALAVVCVALALWSLQQTSPPGANGSSAPPISKTAREGSATTASSANMERVEMPASSPPNKPTASTKSNGETPSKATPAGSTDDEKTNAGKTTGVAPHNNALQAVGARPLKRTLVKLKNPESTEAQDRG